MAHDKAELAVLGGLMLSAEQMPKVTSIISTEMFSTRKRQRLFEAFQEIVSEGNPLDVIFISDKLGKKIDDYGGPQGLVNFMDSVPSSSNLEFYAEKVRADYFKRKILDVSKNIGTKNGIEFKEAADNLKSYLRELNNHSAGLNMSLDPIIERTIKRIDDNRDVVPTGFERLDNILGGLQRREICIVAGRPGNMKTTMACNLANYWLSQGLKTLIFSVEIPSDMYFRKMVCAANGIDTMAIRRKLMTRNQLDELFRLCREYKEYFEGQLLIMDKSNGLRKDPAIMARAMRKFNPDVVMLDYIQKMPTSSQYKRIELEDYAAWLQEVAEEVDAHVTILSQINRSAQYGKKDDYPKIHHLKESGGLEEVADEILLLHYPYTVNKKQSEKFRLRVDIAKNRYGGLKALWLHVAPSQGKISDVGSDIFSPEGVPDSRHKEVSQAGIFGGEA